MPNFQKSIFELIRRTATELPADVCEALAQAQYREAKSSNAELALSTILQNLEIAKRKQVPLCQDTGFPSFFVRAPAGFELAKLEKAILAAVRQATEAGLLRPNAVDALTGENSGDNTGTSFPAIYWDHPPAPSEGGGVEIELLLKGGGSENVSQQISLPAELPDFGAAGRDLAGVKKAVLQVVKSAEGKGCAPGILGVHIGSDRAGGWAAAKKLLLKKIGEPNENPELAQMEAEILAEANGLGIGPMGFGGRTTLLDCRISASHRLPASYFVTVSYLCWAARKGKVILDQKGNVIATDSVIPAKAGIHATSNSWIPDQVGNDKKGIKRLQVPLSDEAVRDLKVGDLVLLSGRIFTGRDQLHSFVAGGGDLPKDLKDSAIYHCGPVAMEQSVMVSSSNHSKEGTLRQAQGDKEWVFKAAGPTTSIREEPYEADFIAQTGVRAVIGKGGMGPKTQAALKKHGAVYLHAIGGAAAFYAEAVKKVHGATYLEWGVPEALWEIEVEDFLAVVTMEAGEVG